MVVIVSFETRFRGQSKSKRAGLQRDALSSCSRRLDSGARCLRPLSPALLDALLVTSGQSECMRYETIEGTGSIVEQR